ncbi:endonuclease/exonuclease/phosphatase family protein [Candidatus Saccharibacteria bacterium]|nr:endonuclease/exonuclease/phosphatase family protein [Candidatus Saccharibacteria bacterium]
MAAEILGVIGWNVCDKAQPADQFRHIELQEARLRQAGARAVLLSLSEVTAPLTRSNYNGETLLELLEQEGFEVNISLTTVFKTLPLFEGLSFASRDPDFVTLIGGSRFVSTHLQWAHFHKIEHLRRKSRFHTRKLGTLVVDGLKVHTTHASYHSPPPVERQAILRQIGPAVGRQMLLGDLNTGVNKKLIKEANKQGWRDLQSSTRRTTWPLRVGRIPLGTFELDHVLVTPDLTDKTSLEVAERGPSDHHPLLVLVES